MSSSETAYQIALFFSNEGLIASTAFVFIVNKHVVLHGGYFMKLSCTIYFIIKLTFQDT